MEKQPARCKIFVAGNHDVVLDKKYAYSQQGSIELMLAKQYYYDAKILLDNFTSIKYLENKDYIFEGVKFYGSPYSPTFGNNWAFNADRGEQIKKVWSQIPSDVNVLITHSPVYGILDRVPDRMQRFPDEDINVGCKDLLEVIKKRLHSLKIHCCGHIHDRYGALLLPVSNTRHVLFSNGAIVDNEHNQLITKPIILKL
jgi:hypothetical protein